MAEIAGSPNFSALDNPRAEAPVPPSVRPDEPAAGDSAPPPREASAQAAAPRDVVEVHNPDQISVAYHVDQKVQQIYVQFVDSKTGAVINQFPPSQVLAFEDQVAQYLESRQQAVRAPAESGQPADATNVKEG